METSKAMHRKIAAGGFVSPAQIVVRAKHEGGVGALYRPPTTKDAVHQMAPNKPRRLPALAREGKHAATRGADDIARALPAL